MKVDVSEVKSYRECKRKHELSSRNRFHLRPTIPNPNFQFGTQFHECLHAMYLKTPIESILKYIDDNVTDSVLWRVMTAMVKGYYEGPYQIDATKYEVLDIEHSFEYPLINDETGEPVGTNVCGSIDMLVKDLDTGLLVGFEHKTAKNFRPEVYDLVDEQPRVYFWAMKKTLEDWHAQGQHLDITGVDCVILNQCKKLQTKFQYQRVECRYDDEDLANFMKSFEHTAMQIVADEPEAPEPGYMKCSMCDYATVCMHYGYKHIDLDNLLQEFEGEFEVRENDHLEDKTKRVVEEANE